MFLAIAAVLYIKKLVKEVEARDFKREIITIILLVLFILHPSITRYAMSLFYCIELDPGEYWLYHDLQVRCWQGPHLVWSLAVGVPVLIVWVIGAPTLGVVFLYRNRHNLEKPWFF